MDRIEWRPMSLPNLARAALNLFGREFAVNDLQTI